MSWVTGLSRSRLCLIGIGLALVAAATMPAEAQLLYGGLVGNVVDAQGAVVPGASVTIVNTDTNLKREMTTDAQGGYSFTNIQAGPYDVRVVLTGFKEIVRTRVPVTVGQISRVDLTLAVGAVSEVVTVQSAAELLQTDKADTHTELNTREITNLPLNQFRNYQALRGARSGLDAGHAAERRDRHAGAFAQRVDERPGRRRQYHAHGRHSERQRGPAAPQHLHPPGGDDRDGQHHDGEHGCRRGHGSRRGDYGHHEVGHEQLQRLGVRVLQQREAERQTLLLRTGCNPAKLPIERQTFGGTLGGPIRAQSIVLLRVCTRGTSAGGTSSSSSTCRLRPCATATSAAPSMRTARSSGSTIPSAGDLGHGDRPRPVREQPDPRGSR